MFNYDVMSKEEAENSRFQLIEKGRYQAVFTRQEYKQSSAGNHMFDVDVAVYDSNGNTHPVRDFLVFSKAMMWKIINCAESVGKLKEYQENKMGEVNLVGLSTIVDIDVQEGRPIPDDKLNGRPKGATYPPKNVIVNYIVGEPNQTSTQKTGAGFDDDIPF